MEENQTNNQSEYCRRDWIIAIAASLVVIVICVVLSVLVYGRLSSGGELGLGLSQSEVTQTPEPDSQQDMDASIGEGTATSSEGFLSGSYLMTNPIESVGCLASFVLLLVGVFALDAYLRRRRERNKQL